MEKAFVTTPSSIHRANKSHDSLIKSEEAFNKSCVVDIIGALFKDSGYRHSLTLVLVIHQSSFK